MRHHRIDYVELSALDLQRAKAFYAAAFGWTFTDYGPMYAGIQGEPHEPGGIAQLEKGKELTTGGPLVVLYSDDLLASERAVTEAGGTITKPPFEFPGGSRFHFLDPEGNELAVWTETG